MILDSWNEVTLPSVRGTMGRTKILITLDSCSNLSLMDEQTWCGSISGVGGKAHCTGSTRAKVKICGKRIAHRFVIMDNCPVQVLAGLDVATTRFASSLARTRSRNLCSLP